MSLRTFLITAPLAVGLIALSGCNFNSYVYRTDVHQGNLVTKEMIDQLVEKGELTVEQGKVLNEELKHTIKEKLTPAPDTETILQNLDTMSVEDLAKLKEKIEQLQKADNEE